MKSHNERTKRCLLALVIWIGISLWPVAVNAHGGGTPQLTDAPVGPYRVYVWTSPEPWRVGPAHVTVAVTRSLPDGQETPVSDAEVTVAFTPAKRPAEAIRSAAIASVGTQVGFYEADAALPAAGDWQITIEIVGREGKGKTFHL